MIQIPTVFVLGAGAHCSYGFPSGPKLKQMIVNSIRDLDPETIDLIEQRCPEVKKVFLDNTRMSFADALSLSGQSSIDDFLHANRHLDGFEIIGKMAIARVLLEIERNCDIKSTKEQDDWIGYLFGKMLEGGINSPDQFINQNKVGFITFNYDRFLELRLFEAIRASFGVDSHTALDTLKKIHIYHIYGTLGRFSAGFWDHQDDDLEDPQLWFSTSKNIHTIHDTEQDDNTLDKAGILLSKASNICMLGFGFHSKNIELLKLVHNSKGDNKYIASSRYDITDPEWKEYTLAFSNASPPITINPAASDHKCLKALRNLEIFIPNSHRSASVRRHS